MLEGEIQARWRETVLQLSSSSYVKRHRSAVNIVSGLIPFLSFVFLT